MALEQLGSDTITFAGGLFDNGRATITLTDHFGNGNSDELFIWDDVTIDGPGANLLTVSGNHEARVFYINSGATVTLRGFTISDGHVWFSDPTGGYGGAIYNAGRLTLDKVQVEHSVAYVRGGGIYTTGGLTPSLTVTNSTIVNNQSGFEGGGIYIDTSSTSVTIVNSTISTNTSGAGPGILDRSNSTHIINSTIT